LHRTKTLVGVLFSFISFLPVSFPLQQTFAQTNESVKILITDAIEDVQNGDTNAALSHSNLALLAANATNVKGKETISMRLTCEHCDELNGKYNITVGMPTINSPESKSIVVNGSIFDSANTQMGVVPVELESTMDDEIVEVIMIDMNTGKTLVNSFDMSKSVVGTMDWAEVTNGFMTQRSQFPQATGSTYENPAIGLKFKYLPEWELRDTPIGVGMTPDEDSVFSIDVYSLDGLPNQTLKDFARYQYAQEFCCSSSTFVVTTVNDNQTAIGQNYTATQLEYTFEGAGTRQGLVVWAINNGTGYQFNYISDQGPAFSKNLPAIRQVLDSVEFIPVEVEEPKVPSFMQ
jgi:hypothetical protein